MNVIELLVAMGFLRLKNDSYGAWIDYMDSNMNYWVYSKSSNELSYGYLTLKLNDINVEFLYNEGRATSCEIKDKFGAFSVSLEPLD